MNTTINTTPAGYPLHTVETAPEGSKTIAAHVQKLFGGTLPNLFAVTAESPELMAANAALLEAAGKVSLSKLEQQVIDLAYSRQNDCGYCVAAHSFLARTLPQEPIQAARAGEAIADPKLEALRQFTVELARTAGHPAPEVVERFYAAGYTRKQALEVILLAGMKTIQNYTNTVADTPIDGLFQK